MARIQLVEIENASPEVKEIYEKALRGKPGNAQKALANRPDMLKNFLPFYASVGRSLDRKLYEMIYLRVSFINGCRYCAQHHVASSKRAGLAADDSEGAERGLLRPLYGKRADCFDLCGEADARAARCERWRFHGAEEALLRECSEIVDLHLLVGLANLTNRSIPSDWNSSSPKRRI